MSDLLYMTHPGLEGDHAPAATTQEAFDGLWSKKGWKLVKDETVTGADGSPAVPSPEDAAELRGQALEDALTAAGLPSTGTADEKRAALADHYVSQGV